MSQWVFQPPLSEQRQIMAHLDDIRRRADSLKKLQAETSTELDALMPSILDKAFRGEFLLALKLEKCQRRNLHTYEEFRKEHAN